MTGVERTWKITIVRLRRSEAGQIRALCVTDTSKYCVIRECIGEYSETDISFPMGLRGCSLNRPPRWVQPLQHLVLLNDLTFKQHGGNLERTVTWLAECNSLFRFRSALVERGSTAARLLDGRGEKVHDHFSSNRPLIFTHERSATDSNTSVRNFSFLELPPSRLRTDSSLARYRARCSSRTQWIC